MACRQANDRLEGGPETRKVEARARLPEWQGPGSAVLAPGYAHERHMPQLRARFRINAPSS